MAADREWSSVSAIERVQLHRRAEALNAERAEEIYRGSVRAWAAQDEGDFPTRSAALISAEEELEVLLRVIGTWALVEPYEVFGPTRPLPDRPPEFD